MIFWAHACTTHSTHSFLRQFWDSFGVIIAPDSRWLNRLTETDRVRSFYLGLTVNYHPVNRLTLRIDTPHRIGAQPRPFSEHRRRLHAGDGGDRLTAKSCGINTAVVRDEPHVCNFRWGLVVQLAAFSCSSRHHATPSSTAASRGLRCYCRPLVLKRERKTGELYSQLSRVLFTNVEKISRPNYKNIYVWSSDGRALVTTVVELI